MVKPSTIEREKPAGQYKPDPSLLEWNQPVSASLPKPAPKPMTLWRALGLSVLGHLAFPFIFGLVLALVFWLIALVFHWNIWDWLKDKPKQDIEFTIVKDTQTKVPPKTYKFLGTHHQQAGGTQQEDKPKPSPAKRPDSLARTAAAPKAPATPAKTTAKQPAPPATVASENAPPLVIDNTTPDPMTAVPLNPEDSLQNSSSERSTFTPEQGPNTNPGVNVAQSDFGPFMAELKRRLNRNWHPNRGENSNKVVLRFDIAKDGSLLEASVETSSGNRSSDEAALEALRQSAPFQHIPQDFTGERIPVLFTFDYTVIGRSRRTHDE